MDTQHDKLFRPNTKRLIDFRGLVKPFIWYPLRPLCSYSSIRGPYLEQWSYCWCLTQESSTRFCFSSQANDFDRTLCRLGIGNKCRTDCGGTPRQWGLCECWECYEVKDHWLLCRRRRPMAAGLCSCLSGGWSCWLVCWLELGWLNSVDGHEHRAQSKSSADADCLAGCD